MAFLSEARSFRAQAFAQRLHALHGWNLMSASKRRGQLFAMFYYRTPAAQARRIAKLIGDAEVMAARNSAKVDGKIEGKIRMQSRKSA